MFCYKSVNCGQGGEGMGRSCRRGCSGLIWAGGLRTLGENVRRSNFSHLRVTQPWTTLPRMRPQGEADQHLQQKLMPRGCRCARWLQTQVHERSPQIKGPSSLILAPAGNGFLYLVSWDISMMLDHEEGGPSWLFPPPPSLLPHSSKR